MEGTVFVSGSINTDLVTYLERLPLPGETITGGTFATFPGGKGANQAVAARRAGARVVMYGCLGNDSLGRERRDGLSAEGIQTGSIRTVEGAASGVATIFVDARGENCIAVASGANSLFDGQGIAFPRPAAGQRFISLFQNEVPQEATEGLIALAHAAGHLVVWNLAPALCRRPSIESLARVDFLICNRAELAVLTGATLAQMAERADLSPLARVALEWGVGNVIVTLGLDGSIWAGPDGTLSLPAFPVDAVDTVGAGDCYCGVFAAALSGGLDIRTSALRAAAAAALSTTRKGAQTAMPVRGEIDAFLSQREG